MWWYKEGNKEQGWRRVGYLSLQALFTYLCDLCAFECAISPLIFNKGDGTNEKGTLLAIL
jgi:hypothetical protein